MKQYDRFGEYMFDLLFAPLKKGKRTVNQLYIFFKVIGRVFDGLKEDALRVRDETNVATASPAMLPVHGQDRDMPRLTGESIEGYRMRLAMKGIIAEKGGLKEGILYALTALGYEQSTIEPFVFQNPERWAEFIIHLKSNKQSGINNLDAILAEVNKVKEGGSKLHEIQLESSPMSATACLSTDATSVSETELPEWRKDYGFMQAIKIAGGFSAASVTELPPAE